MISRRWNINIYIIYIYIYIYIYTVKWHRYGQNHSNRNFTMIRTPPVVQANQSTRFIMLADMGFWNKKGYYKRTYRPGYSYFPIESFDCLLIYS